MRKLTLSISLATLATAGVALAAPHMMHGDVTRAEAQAKAAEHFARMDANGDGVLNEADREAKQAERFAKMDADGNGEVTRAEMDAHHAERKARMEARRTGPDGQRLDYGVERADKRGEHFARLDTDNSGGLSAAELAAGHERMRGHRGGGDGERMGKRGMRGHRGGGMAMLKRADTDGDGAISQAEFTAGALKMFDMADADGNGTVTQAERKAAREKMRAQWKANRAARQQG